MALRITYNTQIIGQILSTPVRKAIEVLKRDIARCCKETEKKGCKISLELQEMESEMFRIFAEEDRNQLTLRASDEMGFVYGIYAVSRQILGVENFWFWNDQKTELREAYEVPGKFHYESRPYAVKYRGWFVNDEVLICQWSVNRRREEPWEMVMEALLRCGGNMIIPGTDRNSEIYRGMAADMGLYVTHHHAEPLGAPMFSRIYPELTPSYSLYPEKFQDLWKQGIERQKDMKIVWNLGFRGQGDRPFWEDDPKYQTPEARGALMSELIMLQYNLVQEVLPGAACCTNLYGETMELFQQGHLKLPKEVIKIWADNGFGKMVTRRQENHNPRIPALPANRSDDKHGIYYHVSFYDLQAANHITMLQNSADFVKRELEDVFAHGVNDYWIINCSNVKPHVYYLDFIASMWRNGEIDIEQHHKQYAKTYYGEKHSEKVAKALEDYAEYAVLYGTQEDEHAGEQFANHVSRMLISQYMKCSKDRSPHLLWATDAESLKGQIEWFYDLCKIGVQNYRTYLTECELAALAMEDEKNAQQLFTDSVLLHAKIHYYSYCGAKLVCEALLEALKENYQKAFYYGGKAREAFLTGNDAMKAVEHGKWQGFYANECLADVKQCGWMLENFMGYVRNLGDGPHFYQWQRDFLYSEEDKRVMLILVMENHLNDLDLFYLMKEKWDK